MDNKFRRENLCDATDLRSLSYSNIIRRPKKRKLKLHREIGKRIKRAQQLALIPDCHLRLTIS